MRKQWVFFVLLLVLGLLQFQLWFGHNSVLERQTMQKRIQKMQQQNHKLIQRNQLLASDIADLKLGVDAMEERARNELGLIIEGETFFRVVE